MGCAVARHPSFEQRGLLDFLLVGVAVPDVDDLMTAGCCEDVCCS